MKRLIAILLPLIVTKLSSFIHPVGETISENVINKIVDKGLQSSRRILMLVIAAAVSAALLIAGIIIGGLNISSQFDQTNSIRFNVGIGFSIVLIICSLTGLYLAFEKKRWTAIRSDEVTEKSMTELQNQSVQFNKRNAKESSAIEVAISQLIMDFIEQRQEDRKHRYSEHQKNFKNQTDTAEKG